VTRNVLEKTTKMVQGSRQIGTQILRETFIYKIILISNIVDKKGSKFNPVFQCFWGRFSDGEISPNLVTLAANRIDRKFIESLF
jgi:hypothetical protein